MTRFVSSRNTISAKTLKRRPLGSVVIRHSIWESVHFTRVAGGWLREREDVTERTSVVSSAAVAAECNNAIGCRESWAKVY